MRYKQQLKKLTDTPVKNEKLSAAMTGCGGEVGKISEPVSPP